MAGLTSEGFTSKSLEEVTSSIESRLEAFNPGFDFSPESPDGQLINIMAVEISQAWSELGLVYNSYNPNVATGQALRNIGLISGLLKDSATRSSAVIDLVGTAGTIVPANSIVSDAEGNEFYIVFDARIPASVDAISLVAGPVPITAGTLVNIVTPVSGWTSIDQPLDGVRGLAPRSEQKYRNLRNKTVLRNYTGVSETMQGRLLELGLQQAKVVNNSSPTITLPDGTPPKTVHVTVGEVGLITDEEIARTILKTISLGCPTFGSTTVNLEDDQGHTQTIKFSKATEVPVFMDINITFLDDDNGGAEEDIKAALVNYVNSLKAGEDVVWSFLFGLITPYADAQVNTLEIGKSLISLASSNIVIADTEYTSITTGDINITVV